MIRPVLLGFHFVIATLLLPAMHSIDAAEPIAPRYLVITDMTHDDPQSLIRLLLYGNEIEIVGIIVTNQRNDHGPASNAPWLAVNRVLDNYGKVVANLKQHDSRYPTAESLKARTWKHSGAPTIAFAPSNDRFEDYIGVGNNKDGKPKSTKATAFLKTLFAQDDSRPLHVGLWGGAVAFSQALWGYRQEATSLQFQDLLSKLYVYDIAAQDITNDFLVNADRLNQAFLGYGKSTFVGDRPIVAKYACFKNWGIYLGDNYIDPAIIRRAGGPLTAAYGGGGEGDSPSFLHLVSSLYGLNDPTDFEQSSWGGHFRVAPEIGPNVMVESSDSPDTLRHWMGVARNDFYARAERAIKPVGEVNRNPALLVNGEQSNAALRLLVLQGSQVGIKVSGKAALEGNRVQLSCREDTQATLRSGPPLVFEIDQQAMLNVSIPAGQTSEMHLLLVCEDNGSPSLQSYKRIILIPGPGESEHENGVLGGRIFGAGEPFDEKAKLNNAFDGDLNTYVDLHKSPVQFVGIDLGTNDKLKRQTRQIRYYPRPDFEFRMVDGEFQGANDASFNDYIVLHKIEAAKSGWNSVTLEWPGTFRYLRYVGPEGGFANVAEIEFVQ